MAFENEITNIIDIIHYISTIAAMYSNDSHTIRVIEKYCKWVTVIW